MRDFVRIALERDARSLPFLDEVRAGVYATDGSAVALPSGGTRGR